MLDKIIVFLKKNFPAFVEFIYGKLKKNNFDIEKTKKELGDGIHKLVLELAEKFTQDAPEGFYGAILEEFDDEMVGGTSNADLMKYGKNDNPIFQYNQLEFVKEYGSCLCTSYATFGVFSDNFGKEISKKERNEICSKRVKIRFERNVGGYLSDGNKVTYEHKKEKGEKIDKFVIHKTSKEFYHLLENSWRLNIGFQAGPEFQKDIEDGTIDNPIKGKIRFGHSTTIRKIPHNGGYEVCLIDSYEGIKKYNIAEIKHIKAFMESNFVFRNVRVLLPEIDSMKPKIFKDVDQKTPFAKVIEWAKNLKISNGYSDGTFRPKKEVTRDEVMAFIYNYNLVVMDVIGKLANQTKNLEKRIGRIERELGK